MSANTPPIMHALLWSQYPLVISKELAARVGLEESIILQEIHYALDKNFNPPFVKDCYWVSENEEGWKRWFPFWEIEFISQILNILVGKALLKKELLEVVGPYDCYTINYSHELLKGE